MTDLFSQVIGMTVTSCYVILFVLILRLCIKKLPKIFSYTLWSVVLFRLTCPFSFSSIFSLIPQKAHSVSQEFISPPLLNSKDIVIADKAPNPTISLTSVFITPDKNMFSIQSIATFVWLVGIFALITYCIISAIKLSKKLKSATLLDKNIYQSTNIKTPFVFGLIRPKIYLPMDLSENEFSYILKHEQTHIKRLDHIIKPLAFLVLSVHWFNPLVWIAYYLMEKDMELSCDESVLKSFENNIKKEYSISLLTLSTSEKSIFTGCPIAFGENCIKSRIKNILSYKKPTLWIISICVVVIITICFGLICNPKIEKFPNQWANTLKIDDIEKIELVAVSNTANKRYKLYTHDNIAQITAYINSFEGEYIDSEMPVSYITYHENAQPTIAKTTLYITTNDGLMHKIVLLGNGFINIDSNCYKADNEWLSKWQYNEGDAPLPKKFGGKNNALEYNFSPSQDLEKSISNAIISKLQKGYPDEFCTQAHKTFHTEEKDGLTYAYLLAKSATFKIINSTLEDSMSGTSPLCLIFNKDTNGNYIQVEYKEPHKFPEEIFPDEVLKIYNKINSHDVIPKLDEQINSNVDHFKKLLQ